LLQLAALSDAGEAFKELGVIIGGLKTIAEESFNFVILQMLKFDRAFADVLDSGKKKLGDFLSKIPGVEVDFGINDQGRIDALKKLDEEIAKREKRSVDFFGTPEEQPQFGPFIEDDDEVQRLIEKNQKIAAIRAAAREEEKEAREAATQEQLDRDAELRQEEADREGEELLAKLQKIEDDKVRNEEAEKEKLKAQKKADADLLKAKEKAEKDLIKIKKNRVDEERKLDKAISDSALDTLSQIVGDNKAAQLAILLVQKALALSRLAIVTEEAALLAFAAQQVPGDPTSFARGTTAAAVVRATGALSAGIIVATAIPEVAGIALGAQEGGIVSGGVFGRDTEPFLLARDEIVLPSRVNPLSPNFDETFGGGLGNQEVTVRIDLSDEASQFITVGQREDTTLGVQR